MYPNLKLQLWRTGTRQNRLAQILGVDEAVVSKIVNGFRRPSAEMQTRMAEVLNCDIDWLFEKADPPPLAQLPAGAQRAGVKQS